MSRRPSEATLSAHGVYFETKPFHVPNGTFASIRDLCNNVFGVTGSTTF
jgi:hypothetical protein